MIDNSKHNSFDPTGEDQQLHQNNPISSPGEAAVERRSSIPSQAAEPLPAQDDTRLSVNPSLDDYLDLHNQLTKFQNKPLVRVAGWLDKHIPENGWINRFLNNLLASLSILKHQGIKELFARIKYKNRNVWTGKKTWRKTDREPLSTPDYYELTDDLSTAILRHATTHPPRKPDIINLPFIDWDFRIQRPQHLAMELAGMGHRVFYIQASFYPGNNLLIKKFQDNVYLVRLPQTSTTVQFHSTLSKENLSSISVSISALRSAFNIQSAIIKVDMPFWRQLASQLHDDYGWKLTYDCMDEHSGFSHNSPIAEKDERILMENGDLVFFSSHVLQDKSTDVVKNSLLVLNGTDFELFHQAAHVMDPVLQQKYNHPVIGYYGAIAYWFDTQLVADLAAKHPEWTFVLVGSTQLADIKPLHGLSNIHLLGEKSYESLPNYLSTFDVCIIPFIRNTLTNATNPVKLYEFLSAGKPVVATRLDEISIYNDYVRLASTMQEWETAIIDSLGESKTEDLLTFRYNFGRINTWKMRAEKLESKLVEIFPKISIIVITCNMLEYTRSCLESIIKNTEYPNYEIIIVDNSSSDGSLEYLTEFSKSHNNVTFIKNETNFGFAVANNQGARVAQGDYLLLLNNDTLVTPGWIHRLLFHMMRNPMAGMVGPVTNDIGNEAKVEVDYTDLSDMNFYAARRAEKYNGISFEIKALALYCAIISRSLYLQLDGLDERYRVGMFEDDDLALKIKQAGLTLLCAEDVFIHHFHGISFTQFDKEELQRIFQENRIKFEQKWGLVWQPHQNRPKPS